MSDERPILWRPSSARAEDSSMAAFMRWLVVERGLDFADYNEMWEWSISDLEAFWSAIWEFFDIRSSAPYDRILATRQMPGAKWCPGARLNYADQILRHSETRPDDIAIVVVSETFERKEMTWTELRDAVASVADNLRRMGVGRGDRVAAILPNTEIALIGFLASASIGAIWSLCAPDMGDVAILDRFRQIEPKVLITQDGYVHAGKQRDCRDALDRIVQGLPGLRHVVVRAVLGPTAAGQIDWTTLTGGEGALDFAQLPLDHPLWIVYSSGTTGNPKPIVHGHGGILLEAAKQSLHHDLGATDRFCWLTSSGWIMWNCQWMALAQGARVVMYDAAANFPDMGVVWRFVAEEELSFFGAGAAYFSACLKAGITPRDRVDLGALRSVGSTGSPLGPDEYDWIYRDVSPDVWLHPISGGTDIAGAFVLGHPMLPVRAGEIQCRALGNAVRAFDPDGNELIGAVGELVCTAPVPSMPLYFWGDTGGARMRESYFDTYPGVWRHGDWIEITPEGGAVIYGRSDATINRRGLRLGSAEIYQTVEGLDAVQDSLVVDLEYLGSDSFMVLFVVPVAGQVLNISLRKRIADAIATSVSPRFVPDEIVEIESVPRTLSGKKLEVPVKRLLLGADPARIVNRDSMANPESFDFFLGYAARRAATES